MKLSVIIPVFRTEATLHRCVESVVSQSFRDLEIILVDDGSPDDCPRLCDEWSRRDERVSVIHKVNGGLSDARNAGIAQARGQYITFVDSDDYLLPDTYIQLMEVLRAAGDIDLLEYPYARKEGNALSMPYTLTDRSFSDARSYWLAGQAYMHTFAWNKIYRRELFNNVVFPKGRVFEDVQTLPELLKQARHIATTSKGCYVYCINGSGITATAQGAEWTMLLEAHLKVLDELQLGSSLPEEQYYMQVLNIQLSTTALTQEAPRLPGRKIKNIWQLRGTTPRAKAIALNILGIINLCKCYRTVFRLLMLR